MLKPQSILFICLAISLCCCKEKHQESYYPIPESLKKACLFQKNSYWVYQNDSTRKVDCTYIKTTPTSGSISLQPNVIIDYIQMPTASSIFYQFYISGAFPRDSKTSYPFLAGVYGAGSCCGGQPAFVLFNDTTTTHQGGQSCQCGSPKYPIYEFSDFFQLGEYSEFNVNGVIFPKVGITRTKYLHPGSHDSSDRDSIDFYFSPGIGLIKIIKRIDTAQENQIPKRATISWSLLRYNVVQ